MFCNFTFVKRRKRKIEVRTYKFGNKKITNILPLCTLFTTFIPSVSSFELASSRSYCGFKTLKNTKGCTKHNLQVAHILAPLLLHNIEQRTPIPKPSRRKIMIKRFRFSKTNCFNLLFETNGGQYLALQPGDLSLGLFSSSE